MCCDLHQLGPYTMYFVRPPTCHPPPAKRVSRQQQTISTNGRFLAAWPPRRACFCWVRASQNTYQRSVSRRIHASTEMIRSRCRHRRRRHVTMLLNPSQSLGAAPAWPSLPLPGCGRSALGHEPDNPRPSWHRMHPSPYQCSSPWPCRATAIIKPKPFGDWAAAAAAAFLLEVLWVAAAAAGFRLVALAIVGRTGRHRQGPRSPCLQLRWPRD
ncbi:hypothetical protein LY76DRAFT_57957 [Colletotrichum caudatum]|nr:hypothetical protein LY76DRAFT_57957 [Colletotrichum caudatum]